MKKKVILPIILLLGLCNLGAQQLAQKMSITSSMEYQYLLYLPDGYDADTAGGYPLLLFLHGGGECGTDIEKVKTLGPPALVQKGKHFPFIILSPQNPYPFKFWDVHALAFLLDSIVKEHRVDEDRIYLAGYSRGAYGAWSLAVQFPERFAALIAISGEAPDQYAAWLGDMPIWVFHGEDDQSISVRSSDDMVAALKQKGNPVHYTRYPATGHDAWTKAFTDPELYEWMLSQTRESQKVKAN